MSGRKMIGKGMAAMHASDRRTTVKPLAALLACAALLAGPAARAEEKPPVAKGSASAKSPAAPARPADPAATAASRKSPYRPTRLTKRASAYFQAAWGVDKLRVSRVASGNLIRFTYRVTDPARAVPFADRKVTPVLYAERAHAQLSIPVMEKIGPLRQTGALKSGEEYWMSFSNKGNLVKVGDRVDVIVGTFRADGLLVQ